MQNTLVSRGLNEEQIRAVAHPGGPALVIAGAGSGKTRVLTHRIAHLIAQGVGAGKILAVTFTNKAAQEMKTRVESLCGPQPDLWIGTFHAMCARLLRMEITKLGMQPNFAILDQQDQNTVIKEVMEDLKMDDRMHRPGSFREQIGRAKNRLLTPRQVHEQATPGASEHLARVYEAYQKKLFASNAMDFDDLLMAAVTLFQKDAQTRRRYQGRFQHILVDEYQDTNHAQYALMRLLTDDACNIFAVGDEDQSIYGFRGAEIHNILDFERDFPQTILYRLQQNYRSTQHILDAANALIRNNRQRKGKTLWTDNGQGDKVLVFGAQDEHEEVEFIAGTIESLHADSGLSLGDVAIFYRVHALSRVLEEGLRRRGIPYEIVGGVGFYERREVKDALAYLRILIAPSDVISLKRIVNTPPRGIGPSAMAIVNDLAIAGNVPLVKAMETAVSQGKLNRKASQGIVHLLKLIHTGSQRQGELGITGTLQWVLEESGYLAQLRAEKTIEAKTRMENLRELSSATEEFEEEHPDLGLGDFLGEVALWTDFDRYEETGEKVTMMSLHSSKGLEFSHVFIAGLEEGIFPYTAWGMDPNELEEERRLLYVGMTRARKRLFLSHTGNRMVFGSRKVLDPSRFLGEIEGTFLERHASRSPVHHHLYDDTTERPRWETRRSAASVVADFHEGQCVIHPKFGPGKILNCFDKGENQKVSIRFESEEHPRLLAVKYANLGVRPRHSPLLP